jgi:hypothetical protein
LSQLPVTAIIIVAILVEDSAAMEAEMFLAEDEEVRSG